MSLSSGDDLSSTVSNEEEQKISIHSDEWDSSSD